jgi:hypothetical protein
VERGGWLPYAPVNMRYSPIMDAHHGVAMIVGAWQKNVRGLDGEAAYSAIRSSTARLYSTFKSSTPTLNTEDAWISRWARSRTKTSTDLI